ncbi:MAG: site-specific DNA-methyltransferase [Actinomycetota bacterium]|nr:site-specific DNA-methyltransferase [Actinomycetota bacterium]MDQ6947213.1 site-specific DNA-methyltransferase [Actinomycetota bacterium]
MTVRQLIGDIRDTVAAIPDASVDLVFTSSPFFQLRSYLQADHPDKAKEIGAEPTPGEFIDALLDVVELLDRPLAPHGSMMWELGDTMSGSGGGGGDYLPGGRREGQPQHYGSAASMREANAAHWRQKDGRAEVTGPAPSPRPLSPRPKYAGRDPKYHAPDRDGDEGAGIIPVRTHSRRQVPGWPLDKSLCMIPELFRVALTYGFNPLTGRQTPPWRVRNVVRWARNNPAVGSLGRRNVERGTGDARYRPATTDLVVICRDRHRYFDLDAIRPANIAGAPPMDHWWFDDDDWYPQDCWAVNTRPYKDAHYATMPVDLPMVPIKSMCPEKVCTICGRPRERLVRRQRSRASDGLSNPPRVPPTRADSSAGTTGIGRRHAVVTSSNTLGWAECGCGARCQPTTWVTVAEAELDEHGDVTGRTLKVRRVHEVGACHDPSHWRPGMVLDPFGGAGTTAVTAQRLGRDCILVDLDDRNAQLVYNRIAHDLTLPIGAPINQRSQLDLFAGEAEPARNGCR